MLKVLWIVHKKNSFSEFNKNKFCSKLLSTGRKDSWATNLKKNELETLCLGGNLCGLKSEVDSGPFLPFSKLDYSETQNSAVELFDVTHGTSDDDH